MPGPPVPSVPVGPDLFRLDGRAAIVTGGGGTLGGAMSLGLARAGAMVLVVDSRLDAAEAVVGQIAAAGGIAEPMQVDVTDRAQVEAMVGRAVQRWGCLDVQINCAGKGARGAAAEYRAEDWEQVFNLNSTALFFCCQAAGRVMLEVGRGSIVNIASIAGMVGYGGNPAYLASKGAVVQITRALAVEWAERGVRVNAISPGVIESPGVTAQMAKEPEFYVAFKARHPVGRFGRPQEMVGPALFLASDASSYVTGLILAADGGYTSA
ncbi:MAG: SDR family oxidoreductase [Chloroflexota bacterium]